MSSSQQNRARFMVSVGLLALMAPGMCLAATPAPSAQLQEVVVTAQKRQQRLQDVPVAETALPSTTLVANRFTNIKDLDQMVPNMAIRTIVGGALLPTVTIRGLVSLGSALGADRGVGHYVDGVYMGSSYAQEAEMAEVSSVEVLRGPQGTLFGRNTTGGAIVIYTPNPLGRFSIKERATVGNFDNHRTSTTINSPQWGPFSALASYTYEDVRGDIRNTGAGTTWNFTGGNANNPVFFTSPKYLGSSRVNAVMTKVRFKPENINLDVVYKFDWTQEDISGIGQGLRYISPSLAALFAAQPNPGLLTPVQSDRPDAVNNFNSIDSKIRDWGHGLTTTYRFNNEVTLKNIAAYRYMEWSAPWSAIDGPGGLQTVGNPALFNFAGFADLHLLPVTATVGTPFVIQATNTTGYDHEYSDELQLNVETKPVTFTGGAYFFRLDSWRAPFGVTGPPGLGRPRSGALRFYPGFQVPCQGSVLNCIAQSSGYFGMVSEVSTKSNAVYGQAEFHVTPKIDLIGGLRYTKDKKTGIDNSNRSGAVFTSYVIDYSKGRLTYNVGINYKITPDILTYGKYVTGYISGGSLAGITYSPETAESWELGVKSEWFQHTLRANLALFDVKYGNIQLPTSGSVLRLGCADAACVARVAGITQALITQGNGRARGFELETYYQPVRQLQFTFATGYTDFHFTSVNPLLLANQIDYHYNARPKWTVDLSGQFTSDPLFEDVHLVARMDANFKGSEWGINGVSNTIAPSELPAYLAAGHIDSNWLVNGRLALEGFKVHGIEGSIAFWGRNIFNDRSPQYEIAFGNLFVSANYERARTFGVDLTLNY
jgi:iron complex outermembrane receptor protein